jgi:hypothetical protein
MRDVPYAMITLVTYEVLQTFFAMRARARVKAQEEALGGANGGYSAGGGVAAAAAAAAASGKSTHVSDAICGAAAGGVGTIFSAPMDVIKTRMMTTKQFMSVPEAAVRILREEGASTFAVGLYPRLMHKIPANALFFLCYETFRRMFGVDGDSR